jgi:hypothetical protein
MGKSLIIRQDLFDRMQKSSSPFLTDSNKNNIQTKQTNFKTIRRNGTASSHGLDADDDDDDDKNGGKLSGEQNLKL